VGGYKKWRGNFQTKEIEDGVRGVFYLIEGGQRKKEDRLFYRKRLFGAWNCIAPSGGIKEKEVRDDVVKEIRKRVKI